MKQHYFILILILSFNFTLLRAQNQQYDFLSELENQGAVNPHRDMVELFLSNFFDTITVNCNNTISIEIFEQRIDTLRNYADKDRENIFGNISYFVINFVLLTGIETELAGNFAGYYNPTNMDLEKWEQWFQEHKDHICLYEQKNILFLRKREKTDCFPNSGDGRIWTRRP